MALATAFVGGILFGGALIHSGMTNPAKVRGTLGIARRCYCYCCRWAA